MDLIEKGKQFAQEGNYGEALDALVLALENDKENPDIHFYIGLCYSSLEEFGYAKYHYQMALSLNPSHDKTKIVWDGIKDITPQKPPEKRITRSAAQKALKKQNESFEEASPRPPVEPVQKEEQAPHKYKMTDEKWEKAFPTDPAATNREPSGMAFTILWGIIAIAIIAFAVYYFLVHHF
jgi:tetratricopeptide (TPR) repeat protein